MDIVGGVNKILLEFIIPGRRALYKLRIRGGSHRSAQLFPLLLHIWLSNRRLRLLSPPPAGQGIRGWTGSLWPLPDDGYFSGFPSNPHGR